MKSENREKWAVGGSQFRVFNYFNSQQGTIRRQPQVNIVNVVTDDSIPGSLKLNSKVSNRPEQTDKSVEKQKIEKYSPNTQKTQTFTEKLQELLTMVTAKPKYKYNSEQLHKTMEYSQWQSQQIDKLKEQLARSYQKLKKVCKMHVHTQNKTLQLEEIQRQLEDEVYCLKKQLAKKDQSIFRLEQKIVKLHNENDELHRKIGQLQMSMISERNIFIQQLKIDILSSQTKDHQIPIINIIPPDQNNQPFYPKVQSLRIHNNPIDEEDRGYESENVKDEVRDYAETGNWLERRTGAERKQLDDTNLMSFEIQNYKPILKQKSQNCR